MHSYDRSNIFTQYYTYTSWDRIHNLSCARTHIKRRDKTRPKSKHTDYNSGMETSTVTGLSQILSDSNSWFKRVTWFIILVLWGIVCCYQLTVCFTLYFQFPTYLQTEFVHNAKIIFPTIFICPGLLRNTKYQFYAKNQSCPDSDAFCSFSDPYVKAVLRNHFPLEQRPPLDIQELWSSFGVTSNNLSVFIPCEVESNDGQCSSLGMALPSSRIFSRTVETFWGSCVIFGQSPEIEFRGPLTFINIMHSIQVHRLVTEQLNEEMKNVKEPELVKSINESLQQQKISLLISAFNTEEINRRHLSFFRSIELLQGYETHVQVQRKKFEFLNTKDKPCVSDSEWIECYNNCIQKNMSQDCSMPYYTGNNLRKNCAFDKTFISLHIKNSVAYNTFDFSACNCSSVCSETVYATTLDTVDKLYDQSNTLIKIYFADPTFEQTTEKYSYTFGEFLSEIGGNLGFFLGISTLTGFEILEYILYYVAKQWRTN